MKIRKLIYFLTIASAVLVLAYSCTEELPYKSETLNLPAETYDYLDFEIPFDGGFGGGIFPGPSQFADFSDVTNEGATLGRVLFYDNKLSLNNKLACASCHFQENGFADKTALSVGFENAITSRNSMSIINVGFQPSLFWDGRVDNLNTMVLQPVKNHIEMGIESIDDLVVKLQASDYYAPLFEDAFGSAEINKEKISSALAQFLKMMISSNSKYDMVMRGEATFTPQESEGMGIFFGKAECYECHSGGDFRGTWSFEANIGLEMNYTDPGMGDLNPSKEGLFRIPTLRNIALTGPYMHDGRFTSLEEVIEHYNSQVVAHPNLDNRLMDWNGSEPNRLGLVDSEKAALIAFLNTLTDHHITTHDMFSDPFSE